MRGICGAISAGLLALTLAGLAPGMAMAQSPGLDTGRDCQTVVTCNFSRGGVMRGCISAYTCRSCRLVASRCAVGTVSRNCRRMVCGWAI